MKRVTGTIAAAFILMVVMFPGAAFAATGANVKAQSPATQAIREKIRDDRQALRAQRQADRQARIDARQAKIAERKAVQAAKRAKVKEKVKQHRINVLERIKARKEANGKTNTPAYQKIVDWLNKLLGTS